MQIALAAVKRLGVPEFDESDIAEDRRGRSQPVAVVGISAIVIFAVLAFGSFDPWSVAIAEIGSAGLLLTWIWPRILTDRLDLRTNGLFPPVGMFGILILAQLASGQTAYAHATRAELWKYASYGCLFLLASQCNRSSVRQLFAVLGVFGCLVALFALVQDLTNNGRIYWYWPVTSGRLFGPYANNSHYAGLMEMLTPISLVLALVEGVNRHRQLVWLAAAVLMGATIFVSGSRGGMIALAAQLVFLLGYFVQRRDRRTACILVAVCLVMAGFVLWIDDGSTRRQLGSLREPLAKADVATRIVISKDSLAMIRERPILGWGLGAFPVVYPQFRSFATNLYVNDAHNDYTQLLAETGLAGFSCMLWFLTDLYRVGFRTLRKSDRFQTGTVIGPLAGCTGILVHSLSDFNLHIFANAALFFVLAGIVSGQSAPLPVTRNERGEW